MAKNDNGSRPRRAHLQAMLGVPWAILPSTLRQIVDAARSGVVLQGSAINDQRPVGAATRTGAVSVIPVHGAIEHRSDWIAEMLGTGASVETLREAIRAELANPAVKAIVLDVDSPGGSVAGITELAAEIRAARGGPKPIVAVANTMAASAAYWLAASCDEMVATPSAQVGAIGIYAVHEDVSRMLDSLGVTMTIVSAGPHKVDGNEFEPLSDEARADIQKRVDSTYDQFIEDVAAGRRVSADQVRADFGGGRVLTAKEALKAGMVDRIGTLSATVQRLALSSGPVSRRMAATGLGPDLEGAADPGEDGGDVIPFSIQLATAADALAEMIERATTRAALRSSEGRPAYSTTTEHALRTIRGAVDALLEPDDPAASEPAPAGPDDPAPGPSTPPFAAIPPRFHSRDEWLRHLETR
jgi:signal peptide peptidase SppA